MNPVKRKIIIATIMHNIMNDSSSSSGSEDYSSSSDKSTDADEDDYLRQKNSIENSPTKTRTFMSSVEEYSNDEFRKQFKITRQTVTFLIDLYQSSAYCPKHTHGGRPKIGAIKEVHIFLYYVVKSVPYRQLGQIFGINETTIWKIVYRVSSWFVSLASQHIIWPRSTQEVQQITASFENIRGITGVLGSVGIIHIGIKKPLNNPEAYRNEQGEYSVTLQAVVNASKQFIDIHCGEPGSLSDAKIFRRSTLYRKASEDKTMFAESTYLLANSSFSLKSWVVPPFKGNDSNLSSQEKKFNRLHSATRIVIDDTFRLMKLRFKRLSFFTDNMQMGTIKNIIVACCVLHNICVEQNDLLCDESADETEVDEADTAMHIKSENYNESTSDLISIKQEVDDE